MLEHVIQQSDHFMSKGREGGQSLKSSLGMCLQLSMGLSLDLCLRVCMCCPWRPKESVV